MSKTVWEVILWIAASMWAVVTSVVGSLLFDILIGQPVAVAPSVLEVVQGHWYLWVVVIVALGVLALFAYIKTRTPPELPPTTRVAIIGQDSSGSAAAAGDNSPITINNDGVLNQIHLRRNRPRELARTTRVIDANLNADDPYWRRVVSTDGSYSLTPKSPEAHEKCPLRVTMETQTSVGETTLHDHLRHVLETQEEVTLDGNQFTDFRSFLGADLMEDMAELPPDVQTRVTISAEPYNGPINCVLRLPDNGAEIKHLALANFVLSNGQRRITNRQDATAPVVVVIDFDPPPDSNTDTETLVTIDQVEFSIGWRPTPLCTARHLLDLYAVIRALQVPHRVEIYNYETMETTCAFEACLANAVDPVESAFADQLAAVQAAFPMETLRITTPITARGMALLATLADVVTTGTLVERCASITLPLTKQQIAQVLSYVDARGDVMVVDEEGTQHPFRIAVAHDVVTLFDTRLDLGEYVRELWPARLIEDPSHLQDSAACLQPGETLDIMFETRDPAMVEIRWHYTRYLPMSRAD